MTYRRTKEVVQERFGDIKVNIFVTGGVVSDEDKADYQGDLDLYIQTPAVSELVNKGKGYMAVDEETGNIAYEIAKKVNGQMPADEKFYRSGGYTDIIISPFLPYECWAMSEGDERYIYNLDKREWWLVRPKEVGTKKR